MTVCLFCTSLTAKNGKRRELLILAPNQKQRQKKQKSAFGAAFNKFQTQSKLGGSDKGNDVALPYRHQNMINDICVQDEGHFTTSSVDGRVLFWDMKKKY